MLTRSLAVLSLLSACAPATPDADVRLDDAFTDAAREYDVPRDLLVAIAWSMTRFDDPVEGDHEHGGMRGYGIMDLSAGRPLSGPDVARGAERIGVTAEEAIHDRALNIELAASELRWKADELEAGGAQFERLSDWVEVVGWYSGSDDGGAQRSYAKQVYAWIEHGLKERDPADGSWIVIESQELDIPTLEMAPALGGSGDSGLNDNVVAAASCNYTNASRGSSTIDMIVVHTAQGSYSGTYNWFQNCSASASAHYVIRASDGEITQMVSEEDTAWHAGDSGTNARSVSIELEGYIEDPDRWYTDAMFTSLAALIQDIADRQGVALDRDHIIGHMEVPGCSYAGGGGRNCHTDPGDGFDWDTLMNKLGSGSSGSSGSESSGSGSSGSESSGSGSSSSSSSSTGTGDLVGFVRKDSIYNTSGAVANASVSLSSGQRATTDSRGFFLVEDVPAGEVTLTVSASGYTTTTDSADIDASAQNWNSVAIVATSGSSTGGVPTNLDPSGYEVVTTESVTLSWSASGATSHEVKIYWWDGSDWSHYYTYTTTSPSKTFWPAVSGTDYAFTVRSRGSSGTSAWSSMSYFSFEG